MPVDRPLLAKRSIRLNKAPYAREKPAYLDTEGNLSKTLTTLRLSGFDMTGLVLDKGSAMVANGGYCDVFVGYIRVKSVPHRKILFGNGGKVKVAVKRIRARLDKDAKLAKTLAREMAVWAQLDHPNILPFLGFTLENDYPSLISEWMELGTVREFLDTHPKFDILRLALGVAEGLKHIHELNIVHSDMKADNVLIGENWQPLICDFGISRMLDSSQKNFVSTTHNGQPRGSTRWMAIELLKPKDNEEDQERKHNKETDVWAFGMTLYEMMAKKIPYAHHKLEVHVLLAVILGELPALPKLQDLSVHLSPVAYSTICKICGSCWASSPEDRQKMTEIASSLSCAAAQKHFRIEAESIRTTSEAARLYHESTQMLDLSRDTALPLELHEILAQLIGARGHGLEVPDPLGRPLMGLPNAVPTPSRLTDGDASFFNFVDFTDLQEGENADFADPTTPPQTPGNRTWSELDSGEIAYFCSSDSWRWD